MTLWVVVKGQGKNETEDSNPDLNKMFLPLLTSYRSSTL